MQPLRVAVVGAGVTGIAVARAVHAAGLEVVVFDSAVEAGGVWASERRYPGIGCQNDRDTYAFSDFPMPGRGDEYPDGAEVRTYLQSFIRARGLQPLLRLQTRVVRASTVEGSWTLELDNGRVERFDRLVVATGLYSKPYLPDHPGVEAFLGAGGSLIAPSALGDGTMLDGKEVVIVGYAKSAADVAVAAQERAASVTVVARRVAWKLPRRIDGRKYEQLAMTRWGEHVLWGPYTTWVGRAIRATTRPVRVILLRRLTRRIVREQHLQRRGLLPPGAANRATHTLTPGFHEAIDDGRIRLVRDASVERLEPGHVVLADGRRLHADTVVAATGFDRDIDFLDADVRERLLDEHGMLRLHRFTIPAGVQNLLFAGWVDSLRTPTTVEVQALWITAHLLGLLPQPSERDWKHDSETVPIDHRLATKHGTPYYAPLAALPDLDRWLRDLNAPLPRRVRIAQLRRPPRPADYARTLRSHDTAAGAAI